MAQVINKTPVAAEKNYAPSNGKYDPGKTYGAIFHPKNTNLLTYAQRTDIVTNLNAALVNASSSIRATFLRKFDPSPENNGEGVTFTTRGQKKKASEMGTWDMVFTLENPYADYIQAAELAPQLKGTRCVLVDENSVMRHNETSTHDIYGFLVDEVTVYPMSEAVLGETVKYQVRIALNDILEVSRAKHTHITNSLGAKVNAFDQTILTGVEQGTLTYNGTSANGVHTFFVEASSGEENLVALYPSTSQLKQVGAFPVTKADGTAVTTTSVDILSVNGEQVLIELTLDQTSYTNGDAAYINGAAIATMFGYIGRYIKFNQIGPITLVK